MNKNDLKDRLKRFSVKAGWICMKFAPTVVNNVYVGQLARCSSSSASNYRAACRGKSKADFLNKLRIVEEELDESMYFFEMLAEFNPDNKVELRELYKEADELLSIIVASINTVLSNIQKEKSSKNLKSLI